MEEKAPIFKTVSIDATTPRTDQEWIENLREMIRRFSQDTICKIDFSTLPEEEQEFDLVVFSVKDLGFSNGSRIPQIIDAGKKRGLKLCPPWLALPLRQQYLNQTIGDKLVIAMEPILDSSGCPFVFTLERCDSALWLQSSWHALSSFWPSSSLFVFVLPRKQAAL